MKLTFLSRNPIYRDVKVVFDFGKRECIQSNTYDEHDITRNDYKCIINANYFFFLMRKHTFFYSTQDFSKITVLKKYKHSIKASYAFIERNVIRIHLKNSYSKL